VHLGVGVPGCKCEFVGVDLWVWVCGRAFMGVYVYLHMSLLVKNDIAGLAKGATLAAPLL